MAMLLNPPLLDIVRLVSSWELSNPCQSLARFPIVNMNLQALTSIDLLLDDSVNSALIHSGSVLRLQRRTVDITGIVKSTLQRVILPTKHVIAVVCVASPIAQDQ